MSGGPFFDELRRGELRSAPALTLTQGHVALHQAVLGDRTAATLDATLARQVFAGAVPVPPGLVIDVAIGQSSVFTGRVRANLFYRGLQLHRLPVAGDTLRTTTEVVALRQNRVRERRDPTGLAVLRIRTCDQDDRPVLDFERCAMLPLSAPGAATPHTDDVEAGRRDVDLGAVAALARAWDLEPLRRAVAAPHASDLRSGDRLAIDDGDVVSDAPALARMTLNVAAVHHDRRSNASGRRLVYGGHTVGLAAHQAARAIPGIAAIVAWHSCDHTGPVHEDDTLTSTVEVEDVAPLERGGAVAHLRSRVRAHRDAEAADVLDWRYVAVVA